MADKKTYKLSVYLIKDNFKSFAEVVKKKADVDEYRLRQELKIDGILYLGRTKKKDFRWQRLLQQGTEKSLPKLQNASNRAVLIMRVEGRIFVLPFGFGKHLINEEAIEREFGLKTALNIVDSDKLRSVDKANLEDLTVLVKTQASRRAKPEEFDLSTVSDLMRGVTGEPFADFSQLGATVTGSEGLYILPKIKFEDIVTHLRSIVKAYASRRYKAKFDWVDNLKAERDPVTTDKLQDHLIADLKAHNTEKIHLSPPTIIDWENYEGFSFTPQGDLQTDLEIDTFYTVKADAIKVLDWDKLKSMRMYIKFADLDATTSTSILQSLNYQTQIGNTVFVFAFGLWYRVNRNYSSAIRKFVASLQESTVSFIDCPAKTSEGTYNDKLAKSDNSLVLLDRKLVSSDVIRSQIEVCDIFSKSKKEFIHIKFKSASSTLSHLFAQGKISGDLLLRDIEFRRNLRTKLHSLGHPATLIPLAEANFKSSKYTITFAIIAKGNKSFVDCLPFFSQLNLRLTAGELKHIGYKIKVKKIQQI